MALVYHGPGHAFEIPHVCIPDGGEKSDRVSYLFFIMMVFSYECLSTKHWILQHKELFQFGALHQGGAHQGLGTVPQVTGSTGILLFQLFFNF